MEITQIWLKLDLIIIEDESNNECELKYYIHHHFYSLSLGLDNWN